MVIFYPQQMNVNIHPAIVKKMFGNFVKGCKRKKSCRTYIVLLQYLSPTLLAQFPSGVKRQGEVQRRC